MAEAMRNHPSRIVVLDEDPTLLGVLEAVLQDEGYVVHGTRWHRDGYALVRELQPDLLILDLTFSGHEGGLALLEQVKQEPALRAMPVLVCSALPPHLLETHAAILTRHGVPVLPKPFDLEPLLRMVEDLLHGHRGGPRSRARRELPHRLAKSRSPAIPMRPAWFTA
jgi:DNA-binding response OmpR family regulator